ncbi:Uncharacterised protein [uncultured archaeon]|nr:Uncharacterised protein [uncultured archaeon]
MAKRNNIKSSLSTTKLSRDPYLQKQEIINQEKIDEQQQNLEQIGETDENPLPNQEGNYYSGLTRQKYKTESLMKIGEKKALRGSREGTGNRGTDYHATELPEQLKAQIKAKYFKKYGFNPKIHSEKQFIEHVIIQVKKERGLDKKEEEHLRNILNK